MYSKLIFAPTLTNLVDKVNDKNNVLEHREKERREREAFLKLDRMGLRVSDKKLKNIKQTKEQSDNAFLRGVNKGTLTSDSKILCCCLLKPYNLLAVCCEYPVLIIVQLTGNLGFTDPIVLSSCATCIFFDSDSKTLYLGH